jgi:hypothetical protein
LVARKGYDSADESVVLREFEKVGYSVSSSAGAMAVRLEILRVENWAAETAAWWVGKKGLCLAVMWAVG